MSAQNVTTYLQGAVNSLKEWCRPWLFTVSPDKSSALFITKGHQGLVEHVSMFGQIIPWQDKTKYLGVFTDKKLSFIPRIKGVQAPLMGRRSKMSIKNKLLLYQTIICCTTSYASVAWS